MRRTFVAAKGFHAPRPSKGPPQTESTSSFTPAVAAVASTTPTGSVTTSTCNTVPTPYTSTTAQAADATSDATKSKPASKQSVASSSTATRKSGRKSTATVTNSNTSGSSSAATSPSKLSGRGSTVGFVLGDRSTLSGHFSANHLRRGVHRENAQTPTLIPATSTNTAPVIVGSERAPTTLQVSVSSSITPPQARGEDRSNKDEFSRKRSRSPSTSAPLSEAARRATTTASTSCVGTADAFNKRPSLLRASRGLPSYSTASHGIRKVFYPPPAELAAAPSLNHVSGSHFSNPARGPMTAAGSKAEIEVTPQGNVPFTVLFPSNTLTSAQEGASSPHSEKQYLSNDYCTPVKKSDLAGEDRLMRDRCGIEPGRYTSTEVGTTVSSSNTTTSQPGTWFLSALEHQQREQQQQLSPTFAATPTTTTLSNSEYIEPFTPSQIDDSQHQPPAPLAPSLSNLCIRLRQVNEQPEQHQQQQQHPTSPLTSQRALSYSQSSSPSQEKPLLQYSPVESPPHSPKTSLACSKEPPAALPNFSCGATGSHAFRAAVMAIQSPFQRFSDAQRAQPAQCPTATIHMLNNASNEIDHIHVNSATTVAARVLPVPGEDSMPLPESDEALQREMAEDLRLSTDVAFTPSGTGSGAPPPQLSQSSLMHDEENDRDLREGRGSWLSLDAAPEVTVSDVPAASAAAPVPLSDGPADLNPPPATLFVEGPPIVLAAVASLKSTDVFLPELPSAAVMQHVHTPVVSFAEAALNSGSTAATTDSHFIPQQQSPSSWPIQDAPFSYLPTPLLSDRSEKISLAVATATAATTAVRCAGGGSRHRTVFSFSSRKAAPSEGEESTSTSSATGLQALTSTSAAVVATVVGNVPTAMSCPEWEGSEHTIVVPPAFVTGGPRQACDKKTHSANTVIKERIEGSMLLGVPLGVSEATEACAAVVIEKPISPVAGDSAEAHTPHDELATSASRTSPRPNAVAAVSVDNGRCVSALDIAPGCMQPLPPPSASTTPSLVSLLETHLPEPSGLSNTPTTPTAASTTPTAAPPLTVQHIQQAEMISSFRVFSPPPATSTAPTSTRPGRTCFRFCSTTHGGTLSLSISPIAAVNSTVTDAVSTADGDTINNSGDSGGGSLPPLRNVNAAPTTTDSSINVATSDGAPRVAGGAHATDPMPLPLEAPPSFIDGNEHVLKRVSATAPSVKDSNEVVPDSFMRVASTVPHPRTDQEEVCAGIDSHIPHMTGCTQENSLGPAPTVPLPNNCTIPAVNNVVASPQGTPLPPSTITTPFPPTNVSDGIYSDKSTGLARVNSSEMQDHSEEVKLPELPHSQSNHNSSSSEVVHSTRPFVSPSPADYFYDLPPSVGHFYTTRRGVSKLYDWQHELLTQQDVRCGRSFIYSLPTSGGKTLVAELSLLRCVLNRRQSSFFVLPFVSLAEEKTLALQPLASMFDFNVDGHYGSSGRFPLCDAPAIYVCTIEKANSLLNYMLEEDRTAEIGAVVVDELHMIGESRRGATLELFLSKLLMIDQARQKRRGKHAAAAAESAQSHCGGSNNTHTAKTNIAVSNGAWPTNEEVEHYPDDPGNEIMGVKAPSEHSGHPPDAEPFVDPGPLQIIGMSATVPNLKTIAQWLHAECFERDFRPVPLRAYSVVGGLVLRDGQHNERNLCGSNVNQHLLELATELPEASVLVFCASRQQCVDTAKGIVCYMKAQAIAGQQLPSFPGGALQPEAPPSVSALGVAFSETLKKSAVTAVPLQATVAIKSLLSDLEALAHYEASQLSEIVPYGVAFHHGGLLAEERELIEAAFRRKHIRILCSTSTLAAGVNLPARRVIIKTPYVGRDFLTKSRYVQMCGRAGRAGLDPYGESYLLLSRRDQSRGHALMQASVEPICSQILEDDQTLTRSLLECVGVGLVTDWASARRWSASLLSSHAVGRVDAAWQNHVKTAATSATQERATGEHTAFAAATAIGGPASASDISVAALNAPQTVSSTDESESSRSVQVPVSAASAPSVSPLSTSVPMPALESMMRASLHTLARCGLVALSYKAHPDDHVEKEENKSDTISEENLFFNNNEDSVAVDGSTISSAATHDNDLQVRVTPFGSSSVRSCFSVEEALLLREELDELRHTGLILSDDLHLCYFLTPLREVGECDWELLRLIMSRMSDSRQRIATLLGVDAYFIDQQAMGLGGPLQASEEGRRRLFTAKRFYVALMLADVLAEVPLTTVEQTYNVNRGQLQNLMRSASMFSSSITSFCHAMEWYSLEAVLSSFVKRLGFGVKPDLLPLMEIRGMQPPRARALWNAGFRKLSQIAAADGDDMVAKVKSMNPPESKSAKFFTKRSALLVIREANLTLQSQIKEKKGELQELTARGSTGR